MFLVYVLLLVSLPNSSQEDCHCLNGCTNFPGSPCQGTMCQSDWFGSYCQKRNIARGKSTWHSSELRGFGGPFPSYKAVDDNTDQTLEHGSCTHTGNTSSGAWWRVDINSTLEIRRMRIYLRSVWTDRNVGLQVKVGDQLCYTLSADNRQETVLNITCVEALNGSSVTISVDGPYLTLCEVQIFQCSNGWFGDDCDKQCQCQNTTEVCGKETGNCRGGCAAGKHGPGCQQDCNNGSFGSGRNKHCQCLTASEACNKETGHCSSGCAAGKQGPGCQQECDDGWFGSDCNKQCQCLTASEACNKETGHCSSGCAAGKQGPGCQQDCGQHHYGVNCSSTCGQCSRMSDCKKDDGTCTQGCKQGYSPPLCKMCAVHFYGPPCQGCGQCKDDSPCSKLNGTCLTGCKPGYEPPLCSTACPAGSYGSLCRECGHCQDNNNCSRQDGTCSTGCEAGYQRPLCHEKCPDTLYGVNCSLSCGQCRTSTTCHHVNGSCHEGCSDGFKEPLCKECADGYYDTNCTACGQCKGGNCNSQDGECLDGCQPGYEAPLCQQECVNNTYGENCQYPCGNCLNGTCQPSNGSCILGCEEGYKGDSCKLSTSSQRGDGSMASSTVWAISGAAVAVLVSVILVVLLVVIKRRRYMKSQQEENTIALGKVKGEKDAPAAGKPALPEKPAKKPKPPADNVYENSEPYYNVVPAPVSLDRLKEYVRDRVTGVGFEHEYKLLRYGIHGAHVEGKKPENKKRNRFLELFPYDDSRVVLMPDGDATWDYIHASYITGFSESSVFIAAQGPNPVTVNDFWRMVWQENVSIIIMLTRVMELNRKKCEQYWPDEKEQKMCGRIVIKPLLATVRADFTIRKYSVHHSTKPSDKRTVTQLHFTSWPDHDVPSATALVDFWKQYRSLTSSEEDVTGPVVVHCSAGVGRTGTFIALDNLFDEAESLNKVNVFSCVSKMREARMNMVQTVEQYRFVHDVLLEALGSKGTFYTSAEFEKTVGSGLTYTRHEEAEMSRQYQSLKAMQQDVDDDAVSAAQLPENRSKNRNQDIVPANNVRPYLSTPVPGHNDYINAVVLPTATRARGIIATQTPVTLTVVDFWRLVYDHDCFTIVCLEDDKLTFQKLYPMMDQMLEIGPFRVTHSTEDTTRGIFTIVQITVTLNEEIDSSRLITVYKMKSRIPGSTEAMLEFVNEIDTKGTSEEHKTLVHCPDGARLCGVFCSVLNIITRLRLDKEVDIYLTIRELQCIRPQLIQSYDQYKFCYDMVKEYHRASSVYANM
ncbi:receptor-type tyrosine-protein phosphatase alpha-like [Haliotis cracherodii]|uniref:receptor-type tyrosine-protein phosphatase alpha-like n=1 Tax=Haliotis cracherodii TaxID=6455 RepID=UPI0039E882F2